VSQYQKGKTNLDFTGARDSEWQWYQLGHMQVCTSLQSDNHASTSLLGFLQTRCPSCRPTNSVKALKAPEHRGIEIHQLSRATTVQICHQLLWLHMACGAADEDHHHAVAADAIHKPPSDWKRPQNQNLKNPLFVVAARDAGLTIKNTKQTKKTQN